MYDTTSVVSLLNDDAAQWNRDLMAKFQAALDQDPSADLMSMFSHSYQYEHYKAQCKPLSWGAEINIETLCELYDEFRDDPEVNLLSAIPRNYTRRITMATGPKVELNNDKDSSAINDQPDFRTRLEAATSAEVVFPLSEGVTSLLSRYSGTPLDESSGPEKLLTASLKQLLWDSTKLWESPIRGIVVKCNEKIVAKVINGNNDYTEYTSLQYLAKEAPDIPSPKPYGCIALGSFRVIFMSYIPDMTLAQAWPNMSHENKLSVQNQLDIIFYRLRTLRQRDGSELGGVCGEGVKDFNVDECALFKGITTTSEFNELQFSAPHHGSNSYVKFLRSLLEHDISNLIHRPVFTHGDVRTANIMVKKNPESDVYVVSGIIDWEDSGFYPEFHESTVITRTLSPVDENDWFLYLPQSISPLKFPLRWVVARLWGIHLRHT